MLRFLVIDDDPADASLAALVLSQAFPDARVEVAGDALEYQALLLAGEPTVAVVERQLAWGNGLGVMARIHRQYPRCVLFLLGRSPSDELGARFVEGGGAGYLSKTSAGYLELPRAVRAALDQRPSEAAGLPWSGFADSLPLGLLSITAEGLIQEANATVANLLGLPVWSDFKGRELTTLLQEDVLPPGFFEGPGPNFVERKWDLGLAGDQCRRLRLRMWRHDDSGQRVSRWLALLEALPQAVPEPVEAPVPSPMTDSGCEEAEQLLYAVSHDLQEPLHMISRHAGLLAAGYRAKLGPEGARLVENLGSSADRMQAMIDAILEYSRIGGRPPPMSKVDMEKVLDEVLSNLKVSLNEAAATVHRAPMPSLPGEYRQLVQLFQNLVGNALKFRGSRALHITLGVKDAGTDWLLAVKDNGIGIDPALQDRVFGMFQRLHTQEEYPGQGIGLALCKRIVEHHHGRIWIRSDNGEGTTVYLTLPKGDGTVMDSGNSGAGRVV